MQQSPYDQHESALSIQALTEWAAGAHLPRLPQISQRFATRPRNERTAGVFRSALGLGLIHAPTHELARQELLHLQLRPSGKVEPPTYGPVQSSDVADCCFELVEQFIGNQMDARLGDIRV